jgi:hypothetical protein
MASAGVVLLLAASALSLAISPRFTWLNSGLLVAYPARSAAWALAAAAGAAVAGLALTRSALRTLAFALAVIAIGFAGQRFRYRLVAENAGLSEQSLFGSTVFPWKDVTRVESGSQRIVVWGRGEDQIRIEVGSFPAEDRARLDRTLARRVRENSGRSQ